MLEVLKKKIHQVEAQFTVDNLKDANSSVMNYCHVLFMGRNKGLSPKDQELILDIYNQRYDFNPFNGVVTKTY